MKTTTEKGDVFVIELTRREARVLRALCDHVGGDAKGPRGVTDKISKALESVDDGQDPVRGDVWMNELWPTGWND